MAPSARKESALSKQEKLELVADMLEINHTTTVIEAFSLASKTGLDLRMLYDIIVGAAGNSTAFQQIGARLLSVDSASTTPSSSMASLQELERKVQKVLAESVTLGLPLPLTNQSAQLLLASKKYSSGPDELAMNALAKTFETLGSDKIEGKQKGLSEVTLSDGSQEEKPSSLEKVAFVGLGAMGLGMATSLIKANVPVVGYDVYPPSLQKFQDVGGKCAKSLEDAVQGAQCLVLMVVSIQQAADIILGTSSSPGIGDLLSPSTPILLHSTVPPSEIVQLQSSLSKLPSKPILIDAPVSGGTIRAAQGDLTIIVSADDHTGSVIKSIRPVLDGMTGGLNIKGRLRVLDGGLGQASFVKLVNQHLAGVHVALAAESLALSTRLGLHAPDLFEYISKGAGQRGTSWMFENRVPHMLTGDLTPLSAGAIFVKDLTIVGSEASNLGIPVFLASSALQLYIYGVGAGWGGDDDSGIVRMWEPLGIKAHQKW
ncbi:ketose-bisphosphate aldolase class-ii family protein [Phaffia rhodozyma]|uniref:Ketose-bisphosphate aldolase class-ii family protein n=1 Tax=Phaffia rhodozyma TaxID=264483 RepID=A0A0F7SL40_PHARH|nr:ketose-bisphosphate aldolase class-ii family protein [Phaffia rhodozyma]